MTRFKFGIEETQELVEFMKGTILVYSPRRPLRERENLIMKQIVREIEQYSSVDYIGTLFAELLKQKPTTHTRRIAESTYRKAERIFRRGSEDSFENIR